MHIIKFLVIYSMKEKYIKGNISSYSVIISYIKMNKNWAGVIGALIMARFSPAKLHIDSHLMLNKNQGSFRHILIIY